jgi:hypothetical protein
MGARACPWGHPRPPPVPRGLPRPPPPAFPAGSGIPPAAAQGPQGMLRQAGAEPGGRGPGVPGVRSLVPSIFVLHHPWGDPGSQPPQVGGSRPRLMRRGIRSRPGERRGIYLRPPLRGPQVDPAQPGGPGGSAVAGGHIFVLGRPAPARSYRSSISSSSARGPRPQFYFWYIFVLPLGAPRSSGAGSAGCAISSSCARPASAWAGPSCRRLKESKSPGI